MQRLKNIMLSLAPFLLIRFMTLAKVPIFYGVRLFGGDLYAIAEKWALDPEQAFSSILFWSTSTIWIGAYLWTYIIFVPILLRIRKRKESKVSWKWAILWVLSGVIINLVGSSMSVFFIERYQIAGYPFAELEEKFTQQFIKAVVIAPIVEEYIFRDRTYFYAKKVFRSEWAPILYQALLFGLSHMNIYQGMYASLSGVFFGICYKRTENLRLCIVIHCIINLLAFVSRL